MSNSYLENPFWHALNTEHSALAISSPLARRYPADVVPFAGLENNRTESLAELRDLLTPGESIYIFGMTPPACPGFETLAELPAWQMTYPHSLAPSPHLNSIAAAGIVNLSPADAPAMVALTDLAFPGFFRPRTYLMGRYYGIHRHGQLVAMAGERLALPGWRELSAICTHPDFTKRGFAKALLNHLLTSHSAAGLRSFLHVSRQNTGAVALYEQMGFTKQSEALFTQIRAAPFK